ncbi:IS481-like element ISAcp2 family transposase [Acidobacterium capsulatum]|uniref:ISAca1, transposase n=1 Tax=Acidobacterium capsulatum (strain ATCC 51196 / DSM 11244 / BCRC 80197 / JCM 7670 / NBRC 15755 / NCIMB 13165 / 161) TaxID=240015 RepID=C1F1E8_ACIC5|nr:IS481-like element ISAcp2 family transposase [Acidobacterium capsulatum]ACO32605.1 ISAca1, transposase [Acidobacterium capsulatum ATCC 51196]ACO33317.1 ISAca1, transposase [Acidobacterium capsulatum ATCC 51196]ACO33357.1 ISAca1, transposase [Acidobacterium capsulatum ATCC 51196]ACO33398.1 ISAca1, transposase [Acidobacterium capsulatum ATCC 51196]ACO33649.1 ISAca1, transposase [Acidobacterium capsulatum ATCC 51196]
MDIHQNARLTPYSREQLARKVICTGCTLKLAAASFNVSAKTAGKWVRRYRAEGSDGLRDRSSRPHRSPRRLPEALRLSVIELRRGYMPGYQIARRSAVSVSSVSRILRRARLSRWRDLNPPPPVVRYEHAAPGDLLHLDIKGMTRFGEVSLRGDGRLRGKKEHPGFLALHVAVDDHSRMVFAQMLADQKAETTIGFLHAAVEFFASHGIGIRALLTDNGSSYRSRQFRQACQQMAIKHSRTRPYTPRTNGKAERFIQTAMREWAYAKHWTDSSQRDQHLQSWIHYYNHERPHGSLNYKPPSSRSQEGTTS